VRFANDTDATVAAAAWIRLDLNLNVMAERGQKAHQSLARKVGKPAIEQRGDFWLVNSHDLGRGQLIQSATPDHLPDVACQLRFGQFFLGLRQAQVGKYIAAAWSYRNAGLSPFDHCS